MDRRPPGSLSLAEERQVRLARLTEAMRSGGPPPPLSGAGFHLYAQEVLYASRPAQRLEYAGGGAYDVPECYLCFAAPLFVPSGRGGMDYQPSVEGQTPRVSSGWRSEGGGILHLTSWRLAFQGEAGDWLDFPFEAVAWSECYIDGMGVCAATWAPMYFRTPYPEWLYAFFRFLADHVVPTVRLHPDLDQRARLRGL